MTTPILAIWILTGALLAAGAALLAGAFMLRGGRLGVRQPVVGGRGCRCAACGYSTDGLEEPICPECGAGFGDAARARERGRRWVMAAGGAAALLMASVGLPLADAARFGIAHAMPNLVLIEALSWRPSTYKALEIELQTRADSGAMRSWERREMARVCAGLVRSGADGGMRRSAAGLLARIARDVDERTIGAMLRDPDAVTRVFAVQTICRGGKPDAWTRRRLTAIAGVDRSAVVRKRAIDAVRYLGGGGAEAQSALTMALLDPNDGVRQRAVFAISESADAPGAMIAVTRRAEDVDQDVREAAAWALAQLAVRHHHAIGVLTDLLRDSSPLVRAWAAAGLGVRGADSSVVLPCLAGVALGDEDAHVRGAAMAAIRTIRTIRG